MAFAISSYQREEDAMIALLDAYRAANQRKDPRCESCMELPHQGRCGCTHVEEFARAQEREVALYALRCEGVLRTPARSAR